jgi:3-oxoadipate enol-lactonase
VHELGGSLNSFDALTELLQDRFTVLRYDLRGHGQSIKTADGYALENQIADLETVLDAAKVTGPFWLLTIAAASPMAVTLAARDRRVAGLILCSAAIAMDDQRAANLCARADEAEREGMTAIIDSTLARSYPPEIRHDTLAFENYWAMLLQNAPSCYAQANRALAATRTAALAAQLTCPVLCLAGRYDKVRPPAIIKELADSIPGSDYAVLEGAHLLPYQNPPAVAEAATRFIASRTQPSV